MSGSTPYAVRSPTQSNQYPPPYSPTHPNRPFFGHEPFQIPPQHLIQTPPPFPPASLVHSPHHTRPTLASPLPPASALPPPPPPPALPPPIGAGPQQYQPLTSSPPFTLQRTYSGHLVHPGMPSPYDVNPSHAHPPGPQNPALQSPMRDHHSLTNGRPGDMSSSESRPQSKDKPDRASNPMSFASILGPSNNEPSPKITEAKLPPARPATPPPPVLPKHIIESKPVPERSPVPKVPEMSAIQPFTNGHTKSQTKADAGHAPKKYLAPPRPRKILTEGEADKILKALAIIDETSFSDAEDASWSEHKERYRQRIRKRAADVYEGELHKRKRRRGFALDSFIRSMDKQALIAAQRFRERFEPIAAKEIADKDHQSEKERKKDMQRKRRREQQIRNEKERLEELVQRAKDAEDQEEAQKYRRQAEKSQARIKQTTELLEGVPPQEDMEVPAPAPNYEGGVTSSFQLATPEPSEPPKKRSKKDPGAPSARLKKSKEKKQAEKDAAEAAYAAMEKDALIQIAPKEESTPAPTGKSKKSKAVVQQEAPASPPPQTVNYESKGYVQIYEQIWRDLARKDIPKVYRIKQVSLATRSENLRKTAILASKQARKWQERTNKSMKDTQARAKRVMREMMSFWKRNEREERDLRRLAERKEIEDAKKAEADREANRQKRKLNFLISQTEIYSHFIGRKIKTDEVERATDDAEVASAQAKSKPAADHDRSMDDLSLSQEHGDHKVTNFEDLDFDAEDESELRRAAAANAASALQDAQDKARNFNAQD
ncbi:hypothetical protein AYL99_03421 [Fonsecaea erecta]|uniref:Chromatin-remodeling ATPase INO80 n=1 Tax=Fonsecaea erecta TaxID=1367422 RepID=A0A178ZN31_9EURO|nr:hypothetical protein AYL99_03421 [Fonsecaea erecta]OAP61220.1 hypothetical protein AYL99_03421 [Fonsecaea erecta]